MLPQDAQIDSSKTEKIPRHRSPNYPSMGLGTAVSKIETLYKGGAMNPLARVSVLKLLGFDKFHGEAGRVLSALKSFGLIEEDNDRIKLSQRAVDIAVRTQSDPKRKEALQKAATNPPIYHELLEQYGGKLPVDAALKPELIAVRRFNPNAVDGFLQDLRDTLEFAGITDSFVVEAPEEMPNGGKLPDAGNKPAIGDYVQWTSQGTDQFTEPPRVRAFSDDGAYAFVEGSNTGLPVRELSVVGPAEAKPTIGKPPTSKTPVQAPPTMRSYSWALSGDFNARLDLFGEAQTEEDIDALGDYVEITIKALKRSLKAKQQGSN